MLEYLKIFFPQLIERIKNSSIIVKISFILLIILFPLLILFLWNNWTELDKILSADIKTNGYQLLLILLSLSLIILLAFLFFKKSKKKLLKLFVKEWLEFMKNFDLLYMYVDVWLLRDKTEKQDEDLWSKMVIHLEKYWPARDRLRKLLFAIGENTLVVYENKHWVQLKSEDDLFKERNYESPFSLLLDLGAPIGEINYHRKAINWSMKISQEYIEHLGYKYPYLEPYTSSLKYT